MSEQERLQINWVTSAGGALGAVSSAVVLSSLGAAGTLVGAAVGSLCITVGGAIYSHYLSMTKNRVAAQALAARRSGRERGAPGGSEADPQQEPGATQEPDRTDGSDGAERAEGAEGAEKGRSVRQLLRGLPWKRIAVISAALFGVAMVLIVAFELLTGRAVSTYTGGTSDSSVGTSIPGWSGTGQTSPDAEPDEPAPGDVEDGGEPQEEAPAEEPADEGDAPQEEAPAEEGDAPQEEAPAEGGDAPQEEAPAEPAPEPAAPEAPAP